MSIQNYLNQIKTAVFGKDVRQSIHDAIKQCYDDASVDNDNANMEVKLARGTHETLNDRITENEKNQEKLSSDLDTNIREIETKINEVAEKGTTVEVIERATKEEVERQIEDGSMALLTIEDKSLTSSKIKNKSLNFSLLDEDIQNKTKELHIIDSNISHTMGFVSSTGIIKSIGEYAYKKIPVEAGETIYITSNCVGTDGALAVFMNESNQFVSYYNKVSEVGGKYYIDEPVTVPSGSSYVLICTSNKNTAPVRVKKYLFLDVVALSGNVKNINERLSKHRNILIGEEISYTLGFITSGGTVQENTNYKYKIIPVKPNTVYYVTSQCKQNSGTLAYFYDSSQGRLGNYKPNNQLESSIYNYVDEKIITPLDCHYIGLCTTNSESTPIILKEEINIDIDIVEIDKLTSNLNVTELQEVHKDISHTMGFVAYTGNIQSIGNYAYKKIPMMEGDILYITSNCVGSNGALAVFMDSNDTFISYYNRVSEVGGKYYIDEKIVAPQNCAYVLICTSNQDTYPIYVKKEVDVSFTYEEFLNFKNSLLKQGELISKKTFDELLFDNHQLEERLVGIDKLVEFAWKPFDKGYVVIIIDDGRHDLCKFLEIFKEYNVPLSCALMSSNLYSIQDDGRYLIDVALDIQANGGEVLSHSTSGSVFTEETTDEDANERFRTSKKILTENGLIINGFVKPGGTGALSRLDKFEHLVRKYYRYGYSSGYSTAYSTGRYAMTGTLENLTSKVDNAIANKSKIIFYSHSFDNDEVTESNLRGLLQYIKDNDGVEVVTTKYLYDNFASNTLENRILALESK